MIRPLLFALALIGAAVATMPRDATAAPGPAAISYELTAFDISTGTLSGVSKLDTLLPPSPILPPNPVRELDATFAAGTRFLAADLDRFDDETCRDLAAAYNDVISIGLGDTSDVYGAIGSLADARCNARVVVNHASNTIISFYPVDPA